MHITKNELRQSKRNNKICKHFLYEVLERSREIFKLRYTAEKKNIGGSFYYRPKDNARYD